MVEYREARARPDSAPGVWVFSDLERLGVDQAFHVGQFHARLAAQPGVRCVNDPVFTRRRFELLRRLHDTGQNPIGIWRIEDRRLPPRWPVFVRMEHQPVLSEGRLIRDREDLARTIAQIDAAGEFRPTVLLQERPEGLPGIDRAVGILRIGDRMLVERPADIGAGPAVDQQVITQARAIFDHARMGYGRLTAAVADGRLIVWDIDTNPSLAQAERRSPAGEVRAALAALGA